jgi:hypothetical protein
MCTHGERRWKVVNGGRGGSGTCCRKNNSGCGPCIHSYMVIRYPNNYHCGISVSALPKPESIALRITQGTLPAVGVTL